MEKQPAIHFNQEDPTQRALMDSVHELAGREQERFFDERVGLLNHRGLVVLLSERMKQAERQFAQEKKAEPLTVVFGDFDGLKRINDTQGHEAGDRALAEFASILRVFNPKVEEKVAESERRGLYLEDFAAAPIICARHTKGDEFVLIISGKSPEEVQEFIAGIQQQVAEKGLSVSFGYQAWEPGYTLRDLIGKSEMRMYAAKHDRQAQETGPESTELMLGKEPPTTSGSVPEEADLPPETPPQ